MAKSEKPSTSTQAKHNASPDDLAKAGTKDSTELTDNELSNVVGGAAVSGGTPANTATKINFPEGNANQPIVIGSVYNG